MAKQTTRARSTRKRAEETQPDANALEGASPTAGAASTDGEASVGGVSTAPDASASEASGVAAVEIELPVGDARGDAPDEATADAMTSPSSETQESDEAPADAMPVATALQAAPITQPLEAITSVADSAPPAATEPPIPSAPPDAPVSSAASTLSVAPEAATPLMAPEVDEADLDVTEQRKAIPGGSLVSRQRWNTLAGAITPAADVTKLDDTPTIQAPLAPAEQTPRASAMENSPAPLSHDEGNGEPDDEVDEWAIADQPTVQLSPQTLPQLAEQARQLRATPPPQTPTPPPAPRRPPLTTPGDEAPNERAAGSFLTETSEHLSWPPRTSVTRRTPIAPEDAPTQEATTPRPPSPRLPARATRPTTPYSPLAPRRPAFTSPDEPRLASPQGRVVPAPPPGVSPAEMSNPRMRRLQELRRQRVSHEHGMAAPEDTPQVAQVVRQWWSDLRPGLETALDYQHVARSSGSHPIPAHESSPTTSRLGDVFGRLARTARELSERAQSAVGPRIKGLHDQVEQAAQDLINRFDGGNVRQQAPFLGPGRIAIFFREGVAVGQAQRLLMNSSARPMRLIPRKHGFLASVRPGSEAGICDQLRRHPYVLDVAYLEYDEYGQPMGDESYDVDGDNDDYDDYYEQADNEYDDDIR